MRLTVRDLFEIPICKNFKLIAGEGGLDKPVLLTEILDFEFAEGISLSREELFTPGSVVLTSFIFAKDDPGRIVKAIERLCEIGISALAYKAVIFPQLPKEALDIADAHDLPILLFGGDEFFEEVILDIRKELDEGEDIYNLEKDLNTVLEQERHPREEAKIARSISQDFKKYMRVVSVKDSARDSDEAIIKLVNKMEGQARINKKASLCKFRDGFFIFLTQDTPEESRFRALMTDIFIALEIDQTSVHCGLSSIRPWAESFGKLLREGFWSGNVASLQDITMCSYEDIGLYRLLIPEIHSPNVQQYMREYLAPLEDNKGELLKTACIYTLSKGDLEESADKLFCHKNTIRYRLAKLHEVLDPTSNEKEFQENLSIAIRIYMLSQFL